MKPLTVLAARELIKQLNRMDLDQADYEHIKELINQLFIGISLRGITLHPDSRLYRGVIYGEKPSAIGQLGHPPEARVVDFQRCNRANSPMFYCSPDPASVFYELNVQPGDRLYLSNWSAVKDFFVLQIAPKEDPSRDHLGDMVVTYFETKFIQPIHSIYSSQYKITAAIAERMSQGNVIDYRSDVPIGALSYPSAAHPARSENIAIRPAIADSCLKLDYVEEVEVIAVSGKRIDYNRIDFASRFPSGQIEWEGQIIHWTAPPASLIIMTAEPDGWVARDENGKIVKPG